MIEIIAFIVKEITKGGAKKIGENCIDRLPKIFKKEPKEKLITREDILNLKKDCFFLCLLFTMTTRFSILVNPSQKYASNKALPWAMVSLGILEIASKKTNNKLEAKN